MTERARRLGIGKKSARVQCAVLYMVSWPFVECSAQYRAKTKSASAFLLTHPREVGGVHEGEQELERIHGDLEKKVKSNILY